MRPLCTLFTFSAVWIIGTLILLLLAENSPEMSVYNPNREPTAQCQCDTLSAQVEKENITSETGKAKMSEVETATAGKIRQDKKSGAWGYIVALKHYEQQTQALKNYLQLQCLANSYGMRTVEPFLERSFLSLPFDRLLKGEKLTVLGDLIDINLWNQQTRIKYEYQPISSWNDFIRSAPRKLVLGCIQHQNPKKLHEPGPGSNYRLGCPKACFTTFKQAVQFLEPHGFTVVRKACANFKHFGEATTTESFLDNLLQHYKPEETTVLLTEFRGFFGLYRLPILSDCGIMHHKLSISAMPSSLLIRESQDYIAKFLEVKPYIAIIVRMERIVLHLHWNITTCTQHLATQLNRLHSEKYLSKKYFLAMDVGKYGSQGSANNHLLPHGMEMFKSIYKDTWSFEKWEESFKSFGRSNASSTGNFVNDDAGYIANLQRVIAAKSDCLIMVGGGGFQSLTRDYYKSYHTDLQTPCIREVCTREARVWKPKQ